MCVAGAWCLSSKAHLTQAAPSRGVNTPLCQSLHQASRQRSSRTRYRDPEHGSLPGITAQLPLSPLAGQSGPTGAFGRQVGWVKVSCCQSSPVI